MNKPYLFVALMLASATTGFAATTEAEFIMAQGSAITKMTSWSQASPYAPEAFSQGLANLSNVKYSAYADGDAAVRAVDDIVATTLSAAREELAEKTRTLFVTITTDALTANPVDGGHLVGTPYEDRFYTHDFKTYNKVCQGSAWLIYESWKSPGKYHMRNNIAHYLSSSEVEGGDGNYQIMPHYLQETQPFFVIDFADNGKMMIKSGDKYIGTDEKGGLAYFDAFSSATSWTFTRAYDPKCDLPRISTAEDPVWYVFRNAYAPEKGVLTSQYPDKKALAIKPISESGMWRFGCTPISDCDWLWTYNKNGAILFATDTGHAETGKPTYDSHGVPYQYPYTAFAVIDGWEDYGVVVWLSNQDRFMNFNNTTSYFADGCPFLLTKGTFNNGYEVNLSWQRDGEFPDGSSYWFIEEAGDAGLQDFLSKRSQYAAELRAYTSSQPWAHGDIIAASDMISAVEYSDYADAASAIDAVRSMADQFIATFPAKMLTAASADEIYFSINNGRRMDAGNASGWMISTDDAGNVSTLASNMADSGATWAVEKVTDSTFRLKNLNGYYIATIRGGQDVKTTKTASSAATFSFALSGGRIVLSSTRSALYMDDAAGALNAGADDDPGSRWVLKTVTVLPENDLVLSDISDQYIYTITSVSAPLVYLEGISDRYYNYARGYLNDGCYWFLDKPENGEGYRFNSHRYAADGVRMCRLSDEYGNISAPIDYYGLRAPGPYLHEHWYCIPVEYDGEHAYLISTCYPPKGNCCISRVMENGVMTYSTADDLANTAWVFTHEKGIDHEKMFEQQRSTYLPRLDALLRVQPFAKDVLEPAREYIANVKMTDFGPDSYSANPALADYVNGVVEKAKWLLEEEPRGCAVYIKNVRRADNNTASYLAAVNGSANTVDLTASTEASATWTLEYFVNGCYRLVNDNGEYLGPLSSSIEIVSDASQAGLYFLDFRNNYMTLADRNNPDNSINVDQSGSNVCVYNADDAGSRWTIELVRLSAIGAVAVDASDGVVEYYDLRGVRVNRTDMAPGLYLERRGNRVSKILVK